MEERLQNILSHRGVASRRAAATLIEDGRVTVDGLVVREPGARFDPAIVAIVVDGKSLTARREQARTIMMYKPAGVLSSVSDPFGGRTVLDVLRASGRVNGRLVPVGRLDKDSEGLLLLSNDGDLTLRLTHPRYEHEKTYIVRAAGRWSEDKLRILRGPVTMPDGYVTRPVPVELIREGRDHVHVLCFTLREGRKRQIRYMCSAAHLVVLSLKRVAIGALRLPEELTPGQWRDLTQEEIMKLEETHVAGPSAPCKTHVPVHSAVRKLTGKPRADKVWSLLVMGALSLFTLVSSAAFEAGFARVDITPPVGIELSGYFYRRVSTGVRDNLEANAIAFSDGTNRAVMLSLDIISARAYFNLYRLGVARATGLPPEAIFIATTHTHTGPVVGACAYGESFADYTRANAYEKELGQRLIITAQQALADLSPASLAIARGEAPNISFIRRYRMKDGQVRTNPGVDNPDIVSSIGLPDDTVQLLRITRPGRSTLVLVNFQCHPDTISGTLISADWPRVVRETVEGGIDNVRCVFLNGAQGDSNHICTDSKKGVPRGREITYRHMGRVVAGAVLARWDACKEVPAGRVAYACAPITTPASRITPEDVVEAKRIDALVKAGREDEVAGQGMQKTTKRAWARRVLALADGTKTFTMPVSVITVGTSLALAGFPGEPFTAYGKAVKANSPFTMTMPACLVNASFGYLPVSSAFSEGGYEANSSYYTAALEGDIVGGMLKTLKALYVDQMK